MLLKLAGHMHNAASIITSWRHCRAKESMLRPARHVTMLVGLVILAAGCTAQASHPTA
jgi:hypothetical protein